MLRRTSLVLLCSAVVLSCGQGDAPVRHAELTFSADIGERRAQFVARRLDADVSHLSEGDRQALRHLVAAAEAVDEIFWLQAWTENPSFSALAFAMEGDGAEAMREYYRIMYGPWDRLDEFEPFVGDHVRPPGAGFYPEDITEQEFEAWIEANPADREAFTSLFTVIRRDGDALVAVPYSEAYRAQLDTAAAELMRLRRRPTTTACGNS